MATAIWQGEAATQVQVDTFTITDVGSSSITYTFTLTNEAGNTETVTFTDDGTATTPANPTASDMTMRAVTRWSLCRQEFN